MQYRQLGKSGLEISELSLGTWQVGGRWGSQFDNANADKILNAAIDHGVNFIDTADVYSEGLSEKAVGRVVNTRSEKIYVATKCGRQIYPHTNEAYTSDVLRKFVDDSLKRLNRERIDLIQLHCPPTEVYYRPEIFRLFDDLKAEGKIAHLGVSVEKVEEGIKALEYPNVISIQIIYNLFRQRPADLLFDLAEKKDVGIIVRVPLASGLLTGRYTEETTFDEGDHRNFNRDGAAFDKGETFSGVNYSLGLQAVADIKNLFPGDDNLASIAIRWILQNPKITTVIPGASRPYQVIQNLQALELENINFDTLHKMNTIYDEMIKNQVHHLW